MKTTHLLLMAGLLCLYTRASSQPPGPIVFSDQDFSALKQEARLHNKYIFIDFYTEWCGPCKWMEKNVFSKSSVGSVLNSHYYSIRIEAEQEEPELVSKYEVSAYPSLVFLSPEGKLLAKVEGAIAAETFVELANDMLSLQEYRNAYQKNEKDADALFDYAKALKWSGEALASRLVARYLKDVPEKKWSKPENWKLIKHFVDGTDLVTMEKINRNAEIKEFYPNSYGEFIQRATNNLLAKSVQKANRYHFKRYEKYVTSNSEYFPNSDSTLLVAQIAFAEVADWENLPNHLEAYINQYEKDNTTAKVNYANYLVDRYHKEDILRKAIEWGKTGVSSNVPQAYLTVALAHEKLNELSLAEAYLVLAKHYMPESEIHHVENASARIKEKVLLNSSTGVTAAQNPGLLDDGRFTLGAGRKRLMYGYPVPSSTSHFIVNIDGKLASNSPRLASKGLAHLQGVLSYSGDAMTPRVQISFDFEGVSILQELLPVDKTFAEITSGLAQYYKVRYTITNQQDKHKRIGLGVLFDTMIDDNDFCPIAADGKLIPSEVGLAYKDMPTELLFYRTRNDTSDMMGTAILQGNGATTPDKIVIGRWPVLHGVTWKLKPQKVPYGDSAYFLKWENKPLKPGGAQVFSTYYGLPAHKRPELRILIEDHRNERYQFNVYFKNGSANLDLNAKIKLSEMIENQDIIISGVLLNGYADVKGEENFNFDLSNRRIESVGKIFKAYGIPYIPKPYGNDRSEHSTLNESYGNVKDRRVEVIVYYKAKTSGIISESTQ